jgi:hypothetical protein
MLQNVVPNFHTVITILEQGGIEVAKKIFVVKIA